MSEQAIRVGVVGAGANARRHHLPKLGAIEGVEIVSVCNRRRSSSMKVAAEFNIPVVYDHWWELIEAPNIDAVVIGTWPYLHCRATVRALQAGKHVMCEARMARNLHEAQQMLAAAQARPDLVTQIVPSPFTLGVDKTIKRLIREGYLGQILAVEVAEHGDFLDEEAPLHWRQDADLSGYNVLGLGIWYEAIMRWLGEANQVAAMGKTFVTMRPDPATGELRPVRIPDHLDVIADMACGAQAHFGLSRVRGLAGTVSITLYGSKGTLHFDGQQLTGGQQGDEQRSVVEIPDNEAGGWRVEEEFINTIRGRERISHTTFEDGVKYMMFTEAVARSMAEGRAISLPLAYS